MQTRAFMSAAPALAGLLLAACADQGASGDGHCVMREVADLPVLTSRMQPIVKVRVNGTPVAFMVDTGAQTSTVTTEATEELGLPVDRDHQTMLLGVGGSTYAYQVTIRSLDLGTAVGHRLDLWEAGSFGGRTIEGLKLDGLFGGDFLANYDVDFDLPAHHVRLFRESDCSDDFAQPWEGLAYKVPITLEHETEIQLDARINGAPVTLVLDSGAGGTILDSDSAHAAGITEAAMAGDHAFVTQGIDGRPVPAHRHLFESLQLGPARITPIWMSVGDIRSRSLLGADFLRSHRVWVSYPHDLIWVQPLAATTHRAG